MSRCRSCRAPIVWAKNTTTGGSMPVDLYPAAGGNVVLELGPTGAQATVLGTPNDHKGPVHYPHFATSPLLPVCCDHLSERYRGERNESR